MAPVLIVYASRISVGTASIASGAAVAKVAAAVPLDGTHEASTDDSDASAAARSSSLHCSRRLPVGVATDMPPIAPPREPSDASVVPFAESPPPKIGCDCFKSESAEEQSAHRMDASLHAAAPAFATALRPAASSSTPSSLVARTPVEPGGNTARMSRVHPSAEKDALRSRAVSSTSSLFTGESNPSRTCTVYTNLAGDWDKSSRRRARAIATARAGSIAAAATAASTAEDSPAATTAAAAVSAPAATLPPASSAHSSTLICCCVGSDNKICCAELCTLPPSPCAPRDSASFKNTSYAPG
eukprot:30628-Pelagococcus_subviridis.AAC.5